MLDINLLFSDLVRSKVIDQWSLSHFRVHSVANFQLLYGSRQCLNKSIMNAFLDEQPVSTYTRLSHTNRLMLHTIFSNQFNNFATSAYSVKKL